MCPPALREQVVKAVHRQGHQGMMRTYHCMQRHRYRPDVSDKIRVIVKMCDTCQKGKKLGKICVGHGGFLFAGYPWKTVGVDLVGPFPDISSQ